MNNNALNSTQLVGIIAGSGIVAAGLLTFLVVKFVIKRGINKSSTTSRNVSPQHATNELA
jgi:hypothetical protein